MKALYSILMLLMLAVPAAACPCTGDDSPCVCDENSDCGGNCTKTEAGEDMANAKADAAYGVKYTEERVINLPQDQGKSFLTIVGKEGETKFEELKEWFKTNKRLKGLASQTHFNTYPNTNPTAVDRFAGVKTFPIIRLQNAKAQRIFEIKGKDIPMSADALANAIERDVKVYTKAQLTEGPLGIFGRNRNNKDNCPDCNNVNNRRKDRRDERRNDNAAPDEDPEPQPLDDSDEGEEESSPFLADTYFPIGAALAVAGAAFLFGGWPEISSRIKKALAPSN